MDVSSIGERLLFAIAFVYRHFYPSQPASLPVISLLKEKWDVLCKQIPRSMVDVVICKAGHGEVTVIVIWLLPDVDTVLLAN